MSKKDGKNSDPNELTEREKEILAYRRDGHSFRETCKELRVSPNEISMAEKKERGEYQIDEKVSPNFENYAEMYRLFSIGKQPVEVAIALNLPVDFVSEQYLEYLKSKRLYSFVQLYERIGDRGVNTVLLAHDSMVEYRFASKPQLVGRYLRYCHEMFNEGINLKKMRESYSKVSQDVQNSISELQELDRQKEAARKTLDDINKKIAERKKELARVNDAIVYQVQANPSATAAQAAKDAAECVLNDNDWMLRAYQEIYLNLLRNNQYVRWLVFPDTRPESLNGIPEQRLIANCQKVIHQAATEYFNRALNEALRRASQAGDNCNNS